MRTEDRLIVYALRLDQEVRTDLRPSESELRGLNWEYVLERAGQDRIGPMLYRCLRDRAGVPVSVMSALERLYHSTGYFTARLQADLGQILRAFAEDGIETMVLKGGVLAEAVYGNPALRWMADLDLLVRENDICLADRRLRSLGWTPLEGQYSHHLPPYAREGSRGVVELHRHVMYGPQFFKEIEELWRRARPIRVAGEDALALCPEDLLLHLCVHASYGGHRQMNGLALHSAYDIARAVRQYREELDWRAVIGRADAYGMADFVYWALYSAWDVCGAPVPKEVLTDFEALCSDLQRRILEIYLRNPVARADTPAFRVWPYGGKDVDRERIRSYLRADIQSMHRPVDMLVLVWGPMYHLARRNSTASACVRAFYWMLARARRSRAACACARMLYRTRVRERSQGIEAQNERQSAVHTT